MHRSVRACRQRRVQGQVTDKNKGGNEHGNEAIQQSSEIGQEPFKAHSQRQEPGIRASSPQDGRDVQMLEHQGKLGVARTKPPDNGGGFQLWAVGV